MRFCEEHWEKLRSAIHARGLTPLVAQSGSEAVARTVAELAGTAHDATYDPLLDCHWMIANAVVTRLGLYLLSGDYCPVCEALRVHPKPCPNGCTDADLERHLLDGPAEAALSRVKQSDVLCAMLGWAVS